MRVISGSVALGTNCATSPTWTIAPFVEVPNCALDDARGFGRTQNVPACAPIKRCVDNRAPPRNIDRQVPHHMIRQTVGGPQNNVLHGFRRIEMRQVAPSVPTFRVVHALRIAHQEVRGPALLRMRARDDAERSSHPGFIPFALITAIASGLRT